MNAEQKRLIGQRGGKENWRLWGPYLAERAWGTVREDYSPSGTAWEYFDHDQARSRAYRWNEDGLGGICDEKQRICFALSLWNGRCYPVTRLSSGAMQEGNTTGALSAPARIPKIPGENVSFPWPFPPISQTL